jgi:hypothetical protein
VLVTRTSIPVAFSVALVLALTVHGATLLPLYRSQGGNA